MGEGEWDVDSDFEALAGHITSGLIETLATRCWLVNEVPGEPSVHYGVTLEGGAYIVVGKRRWLEDDNDERMGYQFELYAAADDPETLLGVVTRNEYMELGSEWIEEFFEHVATTYQRQVAEPALDRIITAARDRELE